MVMVVRMNIFADTERAFNRLFSLFPASCLAVPYEDWDRRELIWKQLNCSVHLYGCFVYDTNGLLSTNFVFGDHTPYGAESFPFTQEAKNKVVENRNQLRKEGSLENLLRAYGSSSSSVEVYEFINPPQKRILRPISEVMAENKHVGLYVCTRGKLIPRLSELYEQCKLEHEEFEIVVLYLPLISGLDPRKFMKKMEREMQKESVRGWWCLPFNNSVSLRFWELTKSYECSFGFEFADWFEDKLIIVGPDGRISDMYGANIVKQYGHVYPFTRNAVVKRKMEEVKKERILELLSGSNLFRGDDPSDTISADELLGRKKKIIVFMGEPGRYVTNGVEYGYIRLVSHYVDMKRRGKEFEVVYIEYCPCDTSETRLWPLPLRMPPQHDVDKLFSEMPWYVLRLDDRTRVSPLAECLIKFFRVQSLVGFREDGCICSVHPLEQLSDPKKYNYLELSLDDTLEKNIYRFHFFNEYREI